MRKLTIKVTQTTTASNLPLPQYATELSSGMDLLAAIEEPIIIKPNQRVLVPTGICVELSEGYEIQIRPRSGLALKKGITVLNTPGTIDADYRGEIKVILMNFGEEDFLIEKGDRIAQMVVMPIVFAEWELVDKLEDSTTRSAGGFGSTGIKITVN